MPLTITARPIGYCSRCSGPLLSTDMCPERECAACSELPPVPLPVPEPLTDAAWNAMAAQDCTSMAERGADEAARVYEERRARENTFHKSAR